MDDYGELEDGELTQDEYNRGEQWALEGSTARPGELYAPEDVEDDEAADRAERRYVNGYLDAEELIDGVGFAEPGGESALRAATSWNPRNRPCPTCGAENVLTPLDVRAGYQCNACASRTEGGW